VGRIEAVGGALDVGDLARELGCSHKHLIALFRDRVGTTPKRLARIVRFHRFLACARDGAAKGADLALACGYYDESHLSRDVRQFTGLSPREARLQIGSLDDLLG
jgi:AraC-like DNA-binding protein